MKQKYLKHRVQAVGGFVLLLLFAIFTIVGVFNLKVVREFLSRASGEKADIVVDVGQELGPMPRPWRNLAQGGEAFDWNLGNIVPKVKQLKPEYIRIDHIYDFYDIVQKNGNSLSFNFSKLDKVLNDITATGAKPFIALSYMPPAIASGDIVSPPNNYADWQLTVQKTIEHISGTRGIENVYYEVWNEPDLFGGWKRSGERNYLQLYTSSALGAAAAKNVKPFKLGGPAITALYKNWFTDFLNHTSKNNLRLDFFSWHRYHKEISQFEKDMQEAELWLQDFPQYSNLELIISEWGHNSNNDPDYDTSFGAIHTVANSIQMVGRVDRAFVFEIEDGLDPAGQARWGRWGLLTHQSHGAQPKPRFNGLKFLDQIGPTQLDLLGKGSWVKALASKNESKQVQVILTNYDPQRANLETVPVTFLNITPGDYLLKQTFFGGQSSSNTVSTSSASLRTFVLMPVNSLALLELIPQLSATSSASPSAIPAVPLATASAQPTPTATTKLTSTPETATASATLSPAPTPAVGSLLPPPTTLRPVSPTLAPTSLPNATLTVSPTKRPGFGELLEP